MQLSQLMSHAKGIFRLIFNICWLMSDFLAVIQSYIYTSKFHKILCPTFFFLIEKQILVCALIIYLNSKILILCKISTEYPFIPCHVMIIELFTPTLADDL